MSPAAPPLILASASPRRREILARHGFGDFLVLPATVAEEVPTAANTLFLALRNAERKAEEVAATHPDAVVIGADTVIELGDEAIGKPASEADARAILRKLSGRTHLVTTGVCVRCRDRRILVRFADSAAVTFRSLSEDTIGTYLALVPVLDKAGAYAAQDHGDLLLETVTGDLETVIGLPGRRLAECLTALFR